MDFFEPDGNTLATVLAIELASVATTPFFELRFFVVFDFVRAFGAVLDFVVAFFVAAFLAISDSAMASALQIILILVSAVLSAVNALSSASQAKAPK